MKKLSLILVSIGILIVTNCFAGSGFRELIYPSALMTTEQKLDFCILAQEKLRLEHNSMGAQFKAGKITQQQWDDYRNNTFEPMNVLICQNIQEQQANLKSNPSYLVNTSAI